MQFGSPYSPAAAGRPSDNTSAGPSLGELSRHRPPHEADDTVTPQRRAPLGSGDEPGDADVDTYLSLADTHSRSELRGGLGYFDDEETALLDDSSAAKSPGNQRLQEEEDEDDDNPIEPMTFSSPTRGPAVDGSASATVPSAAARREERPQEHTRAHLGGPIGKTSSTGSGTGATVAADAFRQLLQEKDDELTEAERALNALQQSNEELLAENVRLQRNQLRQEQRAEEEREALEASHGLVVEQLQRAMRKQGHQYSLIQVELAEGASRREFQQKALGAMMALSTEAMVQAALAGTREDEVKELRQTVSVLTFQLKVTKALELQAQRKKLAAKVAQVNELQSSLSNAQLSVRALEVERRRSATLETTIAELREQVGKAQSENSTVQLAEKEKVFGFQKRIRDAESSHTQEKDSLARTIDNLAKELDVERQRSSTLESTIGELREQSAKVHSKHSTAQMAETEKYLGLQKRILDAEGSHAQEKDELAREISRLSAELAIERQRSAAMEEMRERASQMEVEHSAALKAEKKAYTELESLHSDLKVRQSAQLEAEKMELSEQLARAKQDKEEYALTEKKNAFEYERKVADLESKITEAHHADEEKITLLKQTKGELEKTVELLKAAESEKTQRADELRQLEAARTELTGKYQKLKKDNAAMNEALSKELHAVAKELVSAEEQVKGAQQGMRQQQQAHEKEANALREKIRRTNEEITGREESLGAELGELKEAVRSRIKTLIAEKEQAVSAMEKLKGEHALVSHQYVEETDKKIFKLNEELASKTQQLEEALAKIVSLDEELQRCNRDKDSYRAQGDQANEEIKTQQDAVTAAQRLLKQMESRAEEAEKAEARLLEEQQRKKELGRNVAYTLSVRYSTTSRLRYSYGTWQQFVALCKQQRQQRTKEKAAGTLWRQTARGQAAICYRRWVLFAVQRQKVRLARNAMFTALTKTSSTTRSRVAFRTWLEVVKNKKTRRVKETVTHRLLGTTVHGLQRGFFVTWLRFTRSKRQQKMRLTFSQVTLQRTSRGMQLVAFTRWRNWMEQKRQSTERKASARSAAYHLAARTSSSVRLRTSFATWFRFAKKQKEARVARLSIWQVVAVTEAEEKSRQEIEQLWELVETSCLHFAQSLSAHANAQSEWNRTLGILSKGFVVEAEQQGRREIEELCAVAQSSYSEFAGRITVYAHSQGEWTQKAEVLQQGIVAAQQLADQKEAALVGRTGAIQEWERKMMLDDEDVGRHILEATESKERDSLQSRLVMALTERKGGEYEREIRVLSNNLRLSQKENQLLRSRQKALAELEMSHSANKKERDALEGDFHRYLATRIPMGNNEKTSLPSPSPSVSPLPQSTSSLNTPTPGGTSVGSTVLARLGKSDGWTPKRLEGLGGLSGKSQQQHTAMLIGMWLTKMEGTEAFERHLLQSIAFESLDTLCVMAYRQQAILEAAKSVSAPRASSASDDADRSSYESPWRRRLFA